jgi:hypothetical protein
MISNYNVALIAANSKLTNDIKKLMRRVSELERVCEESLRKKVTINPTELIGAKQRLKKRMEILVESEKIRAEMRLYKMVHPTKGF